MTSAETRFPGPYPPAEAAAYWEAAAAGTLLLRHCADCRTAFLYPRLVCPWCWGERLTWMEASRDGVITARTVVHRAAHPAFATMTPYVCAVVRLAEGPTLMTNVVGETAQTAQVGQRVRIIFAERGGWVLPVAQP